MYRTWQWEEKAAVFFLGSPGPFLWRSSTWIVICLTYVCARLWNDPYLCAYMYCTHEQAANCGVCKKLRIHEALHVERHVVYAFVLSMQPHHHPPPSIPIHPSIHRSIDSPPHPYPYSPYDTAHYTLLYLHLRIICRYASVIWNWDRTSIWEEKWNIITKNEIKGDTHTWSS